MRSYVPGLSTEYLIQVVLLFSHGAFWTSDIFARGLNTQIGKMARKNLSGNNSMETDITSPQNTSQLACTDDGEDFVETESFARGDRDKFPANREWSEYTAARPIS